MRFGLFLFLLVGLTLLRVGLAATTPLTPEEAYLDLLSYEPARGYVDGTPGAALSVYAGKLVGKTTPLTIRLTSPLYGLIASLALFFFIAKCSRESTAIWASIVLNALPSFNFATTHAGPVAGALAGCLLALSCMIHARDHGASTLLWLCSGVALAVAMHFALITFWLVPAILLYVLVTPTIRRKTSLLDHAAFLIPPLVGMGMLMSWNAEHEWIWFAKGTFQSLISLDFADLGQTMIGFGGFVLVLCGITLVGLLIISWQGLRDESSRLLLVIGVTGACVWIFQAMQGINELPVGLVTFSLALAVVLETLAGISSLVPAGASLLLVVAGTAWSFPAMASAGSTNREWRHLTERLLSARAKAVNAEQAQIFLIADTRDTAAMLGHFVKQIDPNYRGWPPVFVRESQDLQGQYTVWPRYDAFEETEKPPDELFEELKADNPYRGQSAIYLSGESPNRLPQSILGAFERVTPLEKIDVLSGGEGKPRTVYLYLCSDYQTLPL